MDPTYYRYFEASQVSLKQYMKADSAQGGFVSLKYKTADVIWDTTGSGIPAAHIYFINSQYLKLVTHVDADMETMDKKEPVNQDAQVVPILWMGNLTVSNRKQQGVMIA